MENFKENLEVLIESFISEIELNEARLNSNDIKRAETLVNLKRAEQAVKKGKAFNDYRKKADTLKNDTVLDDIDQEVIDKSKEQHRRDVQKQKELDERKKKIEAAKSFVMKEDTSAAVESLNNRIDSLSVRMKKERESSKRYLDRLNKEKNNLQIRKSQEIEKNQATESLQESEDENMDFLFSDTTVGNLIQYHLTGSSDGMSKNQLDNYEKLIQFPAIENTLKKITKAFNEKDIEKLKKLKFDLSFLIPKE